MKTIALTGTILSAIILAFGLYLHFVIAPESDIAASEFDRMNTERMEKMDMQDGSAPEMTPEHIAAFEKSEMKVDYGIYCFIGSFLPFLLCGVAAIKKQKMAYIGLLLSLGAFFIGAAYGTHMFS